ncbi:hypothetical protein POPTR_019G065300v4 [Populus trichocarpa]|uniref:Uncharacterized protein n=1 Tax=Populus trichocarpa TaxID=3694 RepID=A0ACC0RJK5_POPTR|nr:hypothetical protein POPTR_019G065300v4 [Populus trichocarpa]
MEKDTSFLLTGIKFNKKRFAGDFSRFKKRKQRNDDSPVDDLSYFKREDTEAEKVVVSVNKKRKRKTKAERVEGFSVFKGSDSVPVVTDEGSEQEENNQKELNRQNERDLRLRKKYGIHVSGNNVPSPLQSFAELSTRYGCESYLLHNLVKLGFKEPTPIQRQAIPVLLSGRECFAKAPTGSGKTLAFVYPMLMKLKQPSKDGIRTVILCHTRELAAQTTRECKKMAKGSKFRIKLMTKELLRNTDFTKLPCDILISTPRRLQLCICKKKKKIDLSSATLPGFVEDVARTVMHDAVRIIVGDKNAASESIKQKLIFAGSEEGKLLALRQSFAESLNPPMLIFVQSIERAEELYGELKFDSIRVGVIHSNLSQEQRESVIDDFRAGKTWVLIATDVLGRGMDFKGVKCVINYDFPDCAASYIHRIGRSGRAGRIGEAITFYTEHDIPYLRNIANVMTASGCEVPSWLTDMPKKKWKKHCPRRESISTKPKDEEE